MASYLFRNFIKSNIVRQPKLSIVQQRNSTTAPRETPRETPRDNLSYVDSVRAPVAIAPSSSKNLNLAVGISLGLSVGLLAQSSILDRIFPKEPVPKRENVTYNNDPKLVQEIITSNKRINEIEGQLMNLKVDLVDQMQRTTARDHKQVTNDSGDVFELSRIIEAHELAAESRLKRQLDEQSRMLTKEHELQVEEVKLRMEKEFRPILNKIRELESRLEKQRQVQRKEKPAKLLWVICQALLDKMRYEPLEPLENDAAYSVLKEFAANNNALAISVLESIPPRALREGVYSQESLKERFSKVDRICRRVALVDAQGGGIMKYLVSYLQSLFMVDNVKISEDEVLGRKLVDPSSWHTFEILARVRYCISSNNLEQAIRYANQLKGQARAVARDWIRDARMHLELRQAFRILSTHAETIAVDSVRQSYAE